MNARFVKTLSLRAALLLGSLSALTLTANAQSPIARASVPFEFAAGGVMLPAGKYSIEVPDLSGVLVLRGATGSSVALLTTFWGSMPSPNASTKLIFERHDGMPYLSAVEWPDQSASVMSPFKHAMKVAATASLH